MPREKFEFLIDRLPTPAGEMIVIADAEGNLRVIDWTDHEARVARDPASQARRRVLRSAASWRRS